MCFSRRKIRQSSRHHFSSALMTPPISLSLHISLHAISSFHLHPSLFLSSSYSVLSPKAICILHRMIKRKQQSKIDPDITEKKNKYSGLIHLPEGRAIKTSLRDLIQQVSSYKCNLCVQSVGEARSGRENNSSCSSL